MVSTRRTILAASCIFPSISCVNTGPHQFLLQLVDLLLLLFNLGRLFKPGIRFTDRLPELRNGFFFLCKHFRRRGDVGKAKFVFFGELGKLGTAEKELLGESAQLRGLGPKHTLYLSAAADVPRNCRDASKMGRQIYARIGINGSSTLREDGHRVIDLKIHVIADGGKLISFRADDPAVLALNFPGTTSLLGELASDHDRLPVILGPVRVLPLVLQRNGDLSATKRRRSEQGI